MRYKILLILLLILPIVNAYYNNSENRNILLECTQPEYKHYGKARKIHNIPDVDIELSINGTSGVNGDIIWVNPQQCRIDYFLPSTEYIIENEEINKRQFCRAFKIRASMYLIYNETNYNVSCGRQYFMDYDCEGCKDNNPEEVYNENLLWHS